MNAAINMLHEFEKEKNWFQLIFSLVKVKKQTDIKRIFIKTKSGLALKLAEAELSSFQKPALQLPSSPGTLFLNNLANTASDICASDGCSS